jgi:hypothetical protein
MSHPYRTVAAPAAAPADAGRDPEALAVYVILAVVGAVRLSVAVALGEDLGPESTVALAMVIAAALGALRR